MEADERYNFIVLGQCCSTSLKIKYLLKVNENFHDVWIVWFLTYQHCIHREKKLHTSVLPIANLQRVYEIFF